MITYPHIRNTTFQLKHFVASEAATPDGAWLALYGELKEVEKNIDALRANELKLKSLKLRLENLRLREEVLRNHENSQQNKRDAILAKLDTVEPDILLLEAELIENEANRYIWEQCLQGYKNEVVKLKEMMDELKPQMKYPDLSPLELAEVIQQEEWKHHLIRLAENYIISSGTIPFDQLQAMRLHPEFSTAIYPAVKNVLVSLNINHFLLDSGNVLAIK